jgi:hypothetical protein
MALDKIHRVRRRGLTPHSVDQLLPGDWMTSLQQQHCQDHPLLNRPQIDSVLALPDPKRAQHPKSQRRAYGVGHAPPTALGI